ncbi:hypothetical protein [Pedobacter sp. MC2016-24]|uniref:hypothetical protein n=1 Tax=Pedobacter sp. MC2016-24 TaxID=2780090 RepID=UPI0018820C8D|nr:hypothetical protein [Pedobacter sp. MC2016-24]MBE9603156.1 hypothetical protein [Pedobacter sp. MC2016-24]
MDINIKNTFKVTGRNFFVIITDADYNDLINIKYVFDMQRKFSFPVYSVEWVNLLNSSMPGIILKYEKDEDLILLEKMAENYVIDVMPWKQSSNI